VDWIKKKKGKFDKEGVEDFNNRQLIKAHKEYSKRLFTQNNRTTRWNFDLINQELYKRLEGLDG
jgi:hypothetical protein